jgi:MFS family permease
MNSAPIRSIILLVAALGAVGFSYAVMSPIYAREVFKGDASMLGWFMSAAGGGAVTAALYLGVRKTIRGLGTVISLGGAAMAMGLVGFALSRWLPLTLFCLALCGMGGVLVMASSNTLVQTMVDDDKRGRVMSLFMMSVMGTLPLGNLLAGSMAARFGPAPTLIASGVICLGVVTVFYMRLPGLREAAAPLLATVDASTLDPVALPVEQEEPKVESP